MVDACQQCPECFPNYESLMEFFENLSSISISRYDVATKCSGFLRNLISFDFFFALSNIIKILEPVEEVQRALQSPNISLRNIQSQIDILKDLLTTYRQDEEFYVFWNEIVSKSKEFDLEEPILPKIRRKPKRIDEGSDPHIYEKPEDYYRIKYFELLHSVQNSLNEHYNKYNAFSKLKNIEELLLSSLNSRSSLASENLKNVL